MPLVGGAFEGEMGWWSPMRRAQLPLDAVRISRSLRRSTRRYTTTVDLDFAGVMKGCSDPKRHGGWIDRRIQDAFTILHRIGHVHSVETWDDAGRLVGGLYGVHQNALFAGESMFHDGKYGTDASKVALLRLIHELHRAEVEVLDVQWLTPHLKSLGAIEIPRSKYLEQLDRLLEQPHNQVWPYGPESKMGGEELLDALREDGHA